MKTLATYLLIALAAVLLGRIGPSFGSSTMSAANPLPKFATVELPGTRIASVRLSESRQQVRIVAAATASTGAFPGYVTTLSALPWQSPGAPPAPLLQIPQILPALPDWDLVADTLDPADFFVYERAGGAINVLVLRDTRGNDLPLSAAHPLESFSHPRMVRRASPRPRPSVIAVSNNRTLVAFPAGLSGTESGYVELGEGAAGVAVATADGYALFVKHIEAGPARNGVLPGILRLYQLDRAFRPLRQVGEPLGKQPVYEFDADLLPEEASPARFVLLATAPGDTLLAVGPLSEKPFARLSLRGEFDSGETMSPAVLAQPPRIHMAFLDKPKADASRLVTGLLELMPR